MSQRILVFALLAFLATPGCEFIPGTGEYQQAKAREAVARTLIDPSSAQFRNEGARDDVVCGEVNGKNRMGAYAGFVRFYVRTADWTARLDPGFDPANLASARSLCLMPGGYGGSSCIRLAEEEANQTLQREFDAFWSSHCAREQEPPVRIPFDPTHSGDGLDNQGEAANSDALDTNMQTDMETGFDSTEAAASELEGSPAEQVGNLAVPPRAPEYQDRLDQNWLNRAIGRAPGGASSSQAAAPG